VDDDDVPDLRVADFSTMKREPMPSVGSMLSDGTR